ncbi:hypothetical protein K6L05_00450 [Salinicoccus roseus]|uniref:hypothetical protein n=1 Tax=Salinicoccus roseus TaxID=45670 RepID=UPI001CA65C65|nr:hypothetical protein [Salinicoccus roseus]MBY8908254.1 hypothetical protein [Salinicoccus roseus]
MLESIIASEIEKSFIEDKCNAFSGKFYVKGADYNSLKQATMILNNKRNFPYMLCLLKDGTTIEFCRDTIKGDELPGIGLLWQEMYDDYFS